jgi:hypothetical protein
LPSMIIATCCGSARGAALAALIGLAIRLA